MWVADSGNSRALEFPTPFSTNEAANLVIGQSSFTTGTADLSSTALDDPLYLAIDSGGNLWVSDFANNRVLEYAASLSTGEAASLVLGQSTFTSSGHSVTSTGLYELDGLAFDASGNIWVADYSNNRVLEYTTSSSTTTTSSTTSSTTSTTTTTTPPPGPPPTLVDGSITWTTPTYLGLVYIYPASVAINGKPFSSTFYESLYAQFQLIPGLPYAGYYQGTFGAISSCQPGSSVTITATVGGITKSATGICPNAGSTSSITMSFP